MVNKSGRGMHKAAFPLHFLDILAALLCALALFSLPGNAEGQKINKYYTSSILENGTLYFIFPIDGFREINSNERLIFDISYLTVNDSITVNFSYYSEAAKPASSINFKSREKDIICPANKIFIEVEKRLSWHHRYTAKVALADLAGYFKSSDAPSIVLITSEEVLEYRVSESVWKKKGSTISSILQMIQVNR